MAPKDLFKISLPYRPRTLQCSHVPYSSVTVLVFHRKSRSDIIEPLYGARLHSTYSKLTVLSQDRSGCKGDTSKKLAILLIVGCSVQYSAAYICNQICVNWKMNIQ